MEDLIVWLKKSNGQYSPTNELGGRISGWETGLEVLSPDEHWDLKCSFNTLQTENISKNSAINHKSIIYKPVYTLNSSLGHKGERFSIEFTAFNQGKMFLNQTNSIDIDPYWLFGLKSSCLLKYGEQELTLFANLENLLDEQYQVIYGYPMPGRTLAIGLKYMLKGK